MTRLTDNAKMLIRLLDDAFAEADENDAPELGWVYTDRKVSAGLRHIDNKHPRIGRQIERSHDYYGFRVRWNPDSILSW